MQERFKSVKDKEVGWDDILSMVVLIVIVLFMWGY